MSASITSEMLDTRTVTSSSSGRFSLPDFRVSKRIRNPMKRKKHGSSGSVSVKSVDGSTKSLSTLLKKKQPSSSLRKKTSIKRLPTIFRSNSSIRSMNAYKYDKHEDDDEDSCTVAAISSPTDSIFKTLFEDDEYDEYGDENKMDTSSSSSMTLYHDDRVHNDIITKNQNVVVTPETPKIIDSVDLFAEYKAQRKARNDVFSPSLSSVAGSEISDGASSISTSLIAQQIEALAGLNTTASCHRSCLFTDDDDDTDDEEDEIEEENEEEVEKVQIEKEESKVDNITSSIASPEPSKPLSIMNHETDTENEHLYPVTQQVSNVLYSVTKSIKKRKHRNRRRSRRHKAMSYGTAARGIYNVRYPLLALSFLTHMNSSGSSGIIVDVNASFQIMDMFYVLFVFVCLMEVQKQLSGVDEDVKMRVVSMVDTKKSENVMVMPSSCLPLSPCSPSALVDRTTSEIRTRRREDGNWREAANL